MCIQFNGLNMKYKSLIGVLVFAIFATDVAMAQFGVDAVRRNTRDRAIESSSNEQAAEIQEAVADEALVPEQVLNSEPARVLATKDIAYGRHERQALDIYLPEDTAGTQANLPVVIFFHGGGYIAGDKSTGEAFNRFLAAEDVIGISAGYRLAPESTWPSGAEDVAGVIQWVQRNIEDYGGNAERIFLLGYSAGAEHVANYVFTEEYQVFEDGVVGSMLVAGATYDLSLGLNASGTALDSEGQAAYFGGDIESFAEMSSIHELEGRKIPLLIAYAQNDFEIVQLQTSALINALYERDNALPSIIQGIGYDHFSLLRHVVAGEPSVVGQQVLSFIQAH